MVWSSLVSLSPSLASVPTRARRGIKPRKILGTRYWEARMGKERKQRRKEWEFLFQHPTLRLSFLFLSECLSFKNIASLSTLVHGGRWTIPCGTGREWNGRANDGRKTEREASQMRRWMLSYSPSPRVPPFFDVIPGQIAEGSHGRHQAGRFSRLVPAWMGGWTDG